MLNPGHGTQNLNQVSSTPEEVLQFQIDNYIEEPGSLSGKYLLAIYFVNTIYTTVGFGDITAENSSERILLIFAMYAGTVSTSPHAFAGLGMCFMCAG